MKGFLKGKQLVVLIIFSIFLLLFLIALFCSLSTTSSEFFAKTFSRSYITVLSALTSIIPISLMEISVIFIVLFSIGLLVKGIINIVKGYKREGIYKFSLIITIIFGVISSYYFACGPSYHRDPLPIELYEEKVEKSEYLHIINYFIDDFNECARNLKFTEDGSLKQEISFDKLNEIVIKEFDKLNDDYYHPFTTRGKPMMSSIIYRSLGIAGVSFSALGEGNVCMLNVYSDIPFCLIHEIAHIKGVLREEDANLLASYICLNSDDYLIRYSGYMRSFFNLIEICNFLPSSNDYMNYIYSSLDRNIINNINFNYYYLNHYDILTDIADFFNDLYLKIFGNGGIGAYDDNMGLEDSGEKDDEGNIIYNPIYSSTQKMMFEHYYANK